MKERCSLVAQKFICKMKFFHKKYNSCFYSPSTLSVVMAVRREANLKKLDEVYGYCDNPQRNIKKLDYTICKAKERANSGEPLTTEKLTTSLMDLFKEAQERFILWGITL
jgi:hypothetical protein